MYGLVNKAIEDFVQSNHGLSTWQKILDKAGVRGESFVSMQSYPDEITYNIVGAASEILGVGADKILEGFGEHWVLVTATEGYGNLLDMFGNNIREFLGNLDSLHSRIGMSFPDLKPPSFQCRDIDAHSLELDYYSDRAGLTPFVVGLLKGLGKRFNITVDVQVVSTKSEGAAHDTFLLRY